MLPPRGIPSSDGLLFGGIPGVVDAWFILPRCLGTMSFEQVLQPAVELAEQGSPISEAGSHAIAAPKKLDDPAYFTIRFHDAYFTIVFREYGAGGGWPTQRDFRCMGNHCGAGKARNALR
jgi:hypothetical protein